MAAYETQGFKLDNSGKRVVVDPVTRIEGHLRIDVDVDGEAATGEARRWWIAPLQIWAVAQAAVVAISAICPWPDSSRSGVAASRALRAGMTMLSSALHRFKAGTPMCSRERVLNCCSQRHRADGGPPSTPWIRSARKVPWCGAATQITPAQRCGCCSA